MNRPNINELFEALNNQPSNIEISEEDLKKGKIERTKDSYFVPTQLQTIFNNLPKEKQDYYKWYGEEYYSRVIDQAQYDIEVEAKKLLSALRAGLPFNDLSDDEKVIIRKIYGLDWYLKLGMTNEIE